MAGYILGLLFQSINASAAADEDHVEADHGRYGNNWTFDCKLQEVPDAVHENNLAPSGPQARFSGGYRTSCKTGDVCAAPKGGDDVPLSGQNRSQQSVHEKTP